MPLDSFLIEPVQRIPRYCLLLSELLKYTDKSHADYENLVYSLKVVSFPPVICVCAILILYYCVCLNPTGPESSQGK